MNFSTLCRCCLKELSLEDVKYSSPWTMDKYIFCIQLQACEEEELPKNFCSTCSSKIESIYIFIKDAQASNQKLKNQISTNKGIKIELNNDNMILFNSSSNNVLENSSFGQRVESKSNYIANNIVSQEDVDIFTSKEHKIGPKITIKKESRKGILKTGTKHVKVRKKRKTNTLEDSDEEDIQDSDDNTQEDVEFPYVPVNKTESESFFLELEPITNIVDENIVKLKQCIEKTEGYFSSNIKTDEDFEENINKCEISKSIENKLNHRHISKNRAHFTCPVCNKIYTQHPSFERHVKTHNPEQETSTTRRAEATEQFRAKPHACGHCGKRFRFRVLLNRHYESAHSDERPYACDHCGKTFKRKGNIVLHIMTHVSKEARERPFECEQCGKRFAEKKGLSIHLYFHTGRRPYTCECCQKSFQTKQILNKHMSMHEERLAVICDICGKGFRDKYKLAEHMPRHTGERSFACGLCSYRAPYRSGLTRHEKRVHKKIHAEKKLSSAAQ